MFVLYYTSSLTFPLKEKTYFLYFTQSQCLFFQTIETKVGITKSDLHTNAAPLEINLTVYIC